MVSYDDLLQVDRMAFGGVENIPFPCIEKHKEM